MNAVNQECRVQLRPTKDMLVELHVKALVGQKNRYNFVMLMLNENDLNATDLSLTKIHMN
jgi:hypothetical protein